MIMNKGAEQMERRFPSAGFKRYLRKQPPVMVPATREAAQEKGASAIRYAGFWMRLWAFLFDLLIVSAINVALVHSWLPFVQTNDHFFGFAVTTVIAPAILYALLFFAYFAGMTKAFSQTLGKMVFGLKVVAADGSPLTWRTLFFREGVGRFIQQAPLPLRFPLLAYIVVACTPKKQGIHDLFAETYVIHCE